MDGDDFCSFPIHGRNLLFLVLRTKAADSFACLPQFRFPHFLQLNFKTVLVIDTAQ